MISARVGRCVCGIGISFHFDNDNRKLSCETARVRFAGAAHETLEQFGPAAWAAPAKVLPFRSGASVSLPRSAR